MDRKKEKIFEAWVSKYSNGQVAEMDLELFDNDGEYMGETTEEVDVDEFYEWLDSNSPFFTTLRGLNDIFETDFREFLESGKWYQNVLQRFFSGIDEKIRMDIEAREESLFDEWKEARCKRDGNID